MTLSGVEWVKAPSPSTPLGTLSRFDKLKAPSMSRGLSNGRSRRAKNAKIA